MSQLCRLCEFQCKTLKTTKRLRGRRTSLDKEIKGNGTVGVAAAPVKKPVSIFALDDLISGPCGFFFITSKQASSLTPPRINTTFKISACNDVILQTRRQWFTASVVSG